MRHWSHILLTHEDLPSSISIHLPAIRKLSITQVAGHSQFSLDSSAQHDLTFNVTSCSHMRRIGQAPDRRSPVDRTGESAVSNPFLVVRPGACCDARPINDDAVVDLERASKRS